MGGALIDLMRARYAPGVSTAWALAASPTEAERFALEVSLRWDRAAAELEDLIRARLPAREDEETAEAAETTPVATTPATPDRSVVPRAREVDAPRTPPARRIRSSPDPQDAGGRRKSLEPSRILAEDPESWSASGERGDARPRRARAEGAPEREPGPGPLPGEEADHPMPTEARRGFESEARGPSRGSLAPGPGETSGRRADPGPREGHVFDPGPGIAVPRAPLEDSCFPRRGGRGFSPDGGAPVPAARRASPGLEESPRYPGRDGGSTAPPAAYGTTPRRGASPGPRLDLLVEEARRRAEALEDWERTAF